jgi:hypothetical protein
MREDQVWTKYQQTTLYVSDATSLFPGEELTDVVSIILENPSLIHSAACSK